MRSRSCSALSSALSRPAKCGDRLWQRHRWSMRHFSRGPDGRLGGFVGEALGMAVIIFVVGFCLTAHRLAPLVPWIVGALVGTGIAALGTATGGSLNPARQFGPAILSGATPYLWVYPVAPMVGAQVAAWLRQAIQSRRAVLTHKLCGTLGDYHTGTPKHNDYEVVR